MCEDCGGLGRPAVVVLQVGDNDRKPGNGNGAAHFSRSQVSGRRLLKGRATAEWKRVGGEKESM